MFNLSKHNKQAQLIHEKYLRKDNVGPKADDAQPITEKELKHRSGDQYVTTEGQMKDKNKHVVSADKDLRVIEKVLDEAKSYVTHRSDKADLPVPPMSVLVEKNRQARMKDYKTEKESHWSLDYDDQNGSLPKWPKIAPQHDKIVLTNDPRRFENTGGFDDLSKGVDKPQIAPLVGKISTASVHHMAESIKIGRSLDFDTAIVAILREADKEKRELTPIEQKTISDLKIARTDFLLNEANSK